MKAVLCKAFGPPESLVVEDTPSPPLGPKQVRIAMHAAGMNFPDTLQIEGKYQFKPAFPFAPGMEGAGEVIEVGAGVQDVKKGDRVMAMLGHGACAEEAVTEARNCIRIPDAMDYVTAAGMCVTYGTVYHSLVHRAALKPGEVLLVHGAAGGVGLNAVELGKIMGATVIATASSVEKLALAKEYGADHLIDYTKESFKDRVKEITDDKGADVIFDPVGGDVFEQSMRCIAWEGRLLVVGFASGKIPSLPANLVLLKGCQVVGVFWGSFVAREPKKHRESFETMFRWWSEGRLRPHVSKTYRLEETVQALKDLAGRRATGKLVVQVR